MRFLGIDLGWQSQPSGLCCLEWRDASLHLLDLCRLEEIPAILAWVDDWLPPGGFGGVAVDAPTLISNATGMRLCDRLTHKHFGRYHAGCYPANLGLAFAERTVGFGLSLEARGFDHAPTMVARSASRFQIEVFPHPATVELFGLERILKYKKGKLAERREELIKLRDYIMDFFPRLEPSVDLQGFQPEVPFTGAALKDLEDQLDSLICAYVAAHWWYWGAERNWVLGDQVAAAAKVTGYIVVPKLGIDTVSSTENAIPIT
jgi:predicted RNase H-like nuclease